MSYEPAATATPGASMPPLVDVLDVVEDDRPVVEDDPLDAVPALTWDSDPADVVEQSLEVGYGEDRDRTE